MQKVEKHQNLFKYTQSYKYKVSLSILVIHAVKQEEKLYIFFLHCILICLFIVDYK